VYTKSLFLLAFLFIFGSFVFSQNSVIVMAEGFEDSPMDAFQEYRSEFGISNARLDMEDNGMIDNSIFNLEYENFDLSLDKVTMKSQEPEISLMTQNQIPESASDFVFHWEQDSSISGLEYSSYINKPLVVSFFDEEIIIPDDSASLKLEREYGILLSNEELEWQNYHSYAMLEIIKTIPSNDLGASKWILTDAHIDGDIKITKTGSLVTVTISQDAFDNANPKIALIDGKKGKYFSQKLHHALVWFITDEGKNENAIEKILNERFGVSTRVKDFEKLTKFTTGESANSFQKFHTWEIVELITMFEEMPKGFHSIDGLDYLVRRADGLPHPLYPSAPAVAWASLDNGYIEFMESAFTVDDTFLHKLIIHEKTHFLWGKLFSRELKDAWIELGGWYKNNDGSSGWSTSKTTEFVSSYAHLISPEEDMAESIAYYIINPDMLKSRSLPKYEFIKDNIMQGTSYMSMIRKDLTFEVYNLDPDYIYPGKIIRVDISIKGEHDEDKRATIEVELNAQNQFEGASGGYFRLYSEIGTYVDVKLKPVDGSDGSILRGNITISKYAKNGFWNTNQIVLYDKQGNQRYQGQNDFGWKFFVNNSLEDVIAPQYVKNTLKLTKRVDSTTYERPIQVLTVSWGVNENQQMKNCFARIGNEDPQSYSMDSYGSYNSTSKTCKVNFKITEYNRSGMYSVKFLKMNDKAGNSGTINFTQLTEENSILITTDNPDTNYPFLDVNDISISAEPVNAQKPNGETKVTIIYNASDDKSGLGTVSYTLRDPQGIEHFDYHYHKNYYTLFFEGNPDELRQYKINLVLPEGAPPGTWGLEQVKLVDKANNQKTYKFTEIVHFEVE
jgi:hypothetical protein